MTRMTRTGLWVGDYDAAQHGRRVCTARQKFNYTNPRQRAARLRAFLYSLSGHSLTAVPLAVASAAVEAAAVRLHRGLAPHALILDRAQGVVRGAEL
jgi:hypothetical protein